MKWFKGILAGGLVALILLPCVLPQQEVKESLPFSVRAIYTDLPYDATWETKPLGNEQMEEVKKALSQSYRFLGSGGQCYSFASADDQYVIKFLKRKPLLLPAWIQRFPFSVFLEGIKEKKMLRKEEQRGRAFAAFKHAFQALTQETGVFFIHLNPTQHIQTLLSVCDAAGEVHQLDLDRVEFVLQKKAVLAHHFIDELMARGDIIGAKRAIGDLLALNVELNQKGFRNRDPSFRSNFGFINGCAVLIDMGRIASHEDAGHLGPFEKELAKTSSGLRKYLVDKHLQLVGHFDACMEEILLQYTEPSE